MNPRLKFKHGGAKPIIPKTKRRPLKTPFENRSVTVTDLEFECFELDYEQ